MYPKAIKEMCNHQVFLNGSVPNFVSLQVACSLKECNYWTFWNIHTSLIDYIEMINYIVTTLIIPISEGGRIVCVGD